MPLIEVEPGVHIHAQSIGAGRPVVLLHGWGFDHRIWDRQVRVLAESGREAIAIDLRGHGRSDRPYGDYSLPRLADDVVHVMTTLELDRPTLVGWSLGGITAFRIAATAPELLARLVLVGSNGVATSRQDGYPFGHPADAHLPAMLANELADRVAARRALLRGAFASPPEESLVEHLLQLTLDTPSWAGAATLTTLLTANQVDYAAGLQVRTAQIIGASDPVFSRRGAAWLAETVPDITQTILENCGHYPTVEAPDAFDAALLHAVG